MNSPETKEALPPAIAINEKSDTGAYELTKSIIWRVNQIIWQIKNAAQKNSSIKIDPVLQDDINITMNSLLARSYVLDKTFSPEMSDGRLHKWEDSVLLSVVNENNEVEYANKSYIKRTEWDLKNTGDLTWLTKNNVNIWVDLTEFKSWNDEADAQMLDMFKVRPDDSATVSLDHNLTMKNFLSIYGKLVSSIPNLWAHLEKTWITQELRENLKRLNKLSLINDAIINNWPMPIFFSQNKEKFVNRKFVEISWYEQDELKKLLDEWKFWSKLIWSTTYGHILRLFVEIKPNESLIEVHQVKRKDWTTINVLWNIHKINFEWDAFWSWIIVSPVNKDWEMIEMEDVNWNPRLYREKAQDKIPDDEIIANDPSMIIER